MNNATSSEKPSLNVYLENQHMALGRFPAQSQTLHWP